MYVEHRIIEVSCIRMVAANSWFVRCRLYNSVITSHAMFGENDPNHFIAIASMLNVAMVVGYAGDFDIKDLAGAMVALATEEVYNLPGASTNCFS
jgi:hypothetical protein